MSTWLCTVVLLACAIQASTQENGVGSPFALDGSKDIVPRKLRGEPSPIHAVVEENAARRSTQAAGFYCDESGIFSSALIFSCTNAMRANPWQFISQLRAKCFADAFMPSITSPPRQALNYNQFLMNAAQAHSVAQANAALMTHQVPGEMDVKQRIVANGYNINRGSENVAFGYKSVLDLMVAWTCSDGHRNDLFACTVWDLGVGVAYSPINGLPYSTQNFGCLTGNCYSCGVDSSWQTNLYGPFGSLGGNPGNPGLGLGIKNQACVTSCPTQYCGDGCCSCFENTFSCPLDCI